MSPRTTTRRQNPFRKAAIDAADALTDLAEELRVYARSAARHVAEEVRTDARKADQQVTRVSRIVANRARALGQAVSEWAKKRPASARERWNRATRRSIGPDDES